MRRCGSITPTCHLRAGCTALPAPPARPVLCGVAGQRKRQHRHTPRTSERSAHRAEWGEEACVRLALAWSACSPVACGSLAAAVVFPLSCSLLRRNEATSTTHITRACVDPNRSSDLLVSSFCAPFHRRQRDAADAVSASNWSMADSRTTHWCRRSRKDGRITKRAAAPINNPCW